MRPLIIGLFIGFAVGSTAPAWSWKSPTDEALDRLTRKLCAIGCVQDELCKKWGYPTEGR